MKQPYLKQWLFLQHTGKKLNNVQGVQLKGTDSRIGTPCFVPYTVLQTNQLSSLENIMRTIIHILLTHCRERRLRLTRYFILYEYDRDVMWCNKACWIDCFSLYCPLSDNVPHRVEMYLKLYCTHLTVPSCTVPFNRVRTFVYCTWAKFALRY